MALDPRIEAIRVEYGLEASDFWELPQKKGTWIAKHSALEVVAVRGNIWWTDIQIVEADTANGIAVMIVKGTKGDRVEWATGEASPKNNKNTYPWAMAEKRAKDRVVLKLIGIAGLLYSEEEADNFKQDQVYAAPEPEKRQTHKEKTGQTVEETRPIWKEMADEIANCQSIEELFSLWSGTAFKAEYAKLPASWQVEILNAKDVRKEELTGVA